MLRRVGRGIKRAAQWISKPFRRKPPNPDLIRLAELERKRSERAAQLRKTLNYLRVLAYSHSTKTDAQIVADAKEKFEQEKNAGEKQIAELNEQIGELKQKLGMVPTKGKTKKK